MVKIFMGKIFAYSIEKISQNSGNSVDKNFVLLSWRNLWWVNRNHSYWKEDMPLFGYSNTACSDDILKRMGRRTSNKQLREIIGKLRKRIPDKF